MAFRIRRTRTTCLTALLLVVAMFIVLNVFFVEMNSRVSNLGSVKYLGDSDDPVKHGPKSKKSFLPADFQMNFAGQAQRKPKTMNFENGSDEDMDEPGVNKFETEMFQDRPKNYKNKNTKDALNDLLSTSYQDIEAIQDLDDDDYDEDDDDYDYDDEYINNPNPVFKPGDFGDIRGLEYFKKPKLKFETVKPAKKHRITTGQSSKQIPDVIQNEMYWSSVVEDSIPKGLSYRNITKLIHSLRRQPVLTMDDPTWDRCGRPKNGFIILSDGTQLCVRYRHPHTHFVYGEALSFYLSRLLGMDSVPAVVLATTNSTSRQWRAVNISSLDWEDNRMVAFIQWIDNLNSGHRSRAHIPILLLEAYHSGVPVRASTIYKALRTNTTMAQLSDIAQWGTMIVFDYLTGNYDRVASMQDATEKEQNTHIMEESMRNLRKSSQTRKLWLIDNESGLFDSYELLRPNNQKSRFSKFHMQMLQTMCVFQSSLVNALYNLSEQPSPHLRLLKFATSLEPLMKFLPKDKHYDLFVSMFEDRLRDVISWIESCKQSANR